MNWFWGLFVSLILGSLVTSYFVVFIRKWQRREECAWKSHLAFYLGFKPYPGILAKERDFPPLITGLLERLFFTFLIGFNVVGVPIAMMGWIAVKMTNNWASVMSYSDQRKILLPLISSGFMGALISMGFAYLGGLICNGTI